MNKDTIVISLGGSIMVPDEVNVDFLKSFIELIKRFVSEGKSFIIITGGGKTARRYIGALEAYGDFSQDEKDEVGILSTQINAQLLRTMLGSIAHSKTILNPDDLQEVTSPVAVGAGWQPGHSTDYDAVLMADVIGARTVINFSNIDYVYDKDPNKFDDAQKIEQLTWDQYFEIIPKEFIPGLSSPFDPVASRYAYEKGLSVIICGPDIENIEKYMQTGKIDGSIIS